MTATVRPAGSPAHAGGPPEPIVPVRLRRALLEIARTALRVATGAAASLELATPVRGRLPTEHPAVLRASVFVTLTKGGALRGCVGTLEPDLPIEETVALAAVSAARHDPRFSPVEASELPLIHVDVSVLGEPTELADLAEFVPGVHGVIVELGGRRALLLPEVATDHGWDGERMLEAASEKAGLLPDAWQDQRTRLLIFRTVRFGGPALEEGEAAG